MTTHTVTRVIQLKRSSGAYRTGSVQFFPWTLDSSKEVFDGKWHLSTSWRSMIDQYSQSFVAGYNAQLYILCTDKKLEEIVSLDVSLPDPPNDPDDPTIAAWALCSEPSPEPLIILADHRCIFVYSVRKRAVVGYVRGHGGRITSISVHPTRPNIFASTSADFTVRIYNLDLKQEENLRTPKWPPLGIPVHGSAALGIDGVDAVGRGYGRCIQLLVGGRAGGHNWEVGTSAFHPRLPLLATGGVDRYVKIWRIHLGSTNVVREDKPLFSSAITTSRVLSIAWLAEDVLMTHTATTFTPRKAESDDDEPGMPEPEIEPATLDVFQWLGCERYFPDGDPEPDSLLRGGASDYQNSASYMKLSSLDLPLDRSLQDREAITNLSQTRVSASQKGHCLVMNAQSRIRARGSTSLNFVSLDISQMEPLCRPMTPTALDVDVALKRLRLEPGPNDPRPDHQNPLFMSCSQTPSHIIAIDSVGKVWILRSM